MISATCEKFCFRCAITWIANSMFFLRVIRAGSRIIGSESEMFRLALVEAFRQILKNCAHLLGIELLEEM